MAEFIQLTPEDCKYLLDLIDEMDSETIYTAKQRSFTIPKLKKIAQNPQDLNSRLFYKDVEYLLDLIEDDDLPEFEKSREMARETLLKIQDLQQGRFEETRSIDQQREARRLKRLGK